MWIRALVGARSRYERAASAGDDIQLDRSLHLGVQAHERLERAGRLDRTRELDLATVQLGAAGCLDGVSDITLCHRAEEATGLARLCDNLDRLGLELTLHSLGLVEGLDLADLAALLDRGDLLGDALGPACGQTSTQQEIACVTVFDVHDVTGGPEARDLVSQNNLHCASPSRSASSASRAGVGQQGHLTGILDGRGDETLLLCGHTGHPASADLAAIGDELAQERSVLVVDVLDLRRLERVGLLLGLAHYGLGHRVALHFLRGAQGFRALGWHNFCQSCLAYGTE